MKEIDILTTCGIFNSEEGISTEDLSRLVKKKGETNWTDWIVSQIKQDSVELYKEWYDRMLQRGAICDELMEANDKLFGEEE